MADCVHFVPSSLQTQAFDGSGVAIILSTMQACLHFISVATSYLHGEATSFQKPKIIDDFGLLMAGAVRIELTSRGSESLVLPLHYAPLVRKSIFSFDYTVFLTTTQLNKISFWYIFRYISWVKIWVKF
ncbi:MAG: hypothetical protein FWD49_01830 [Firmicutes bacterium]|nr:hypothetical protein [Bacillota bacterium]